MTNYASERINEIRREHDRRDAERMATFAEREKERRRSERPKSARPKPTGHVYFLRAGNTVKIGFSTNLSERLRNIRTGCPEKVRLVKVVAGTMKTERMYHDRYAEYRLDGEWFDLRGRLAKYLEMCVKPIAIPEPFPVQMEDEFYL